MRCEELLYVVIVLLVLLLVGVRDAYSADWQEPGDQALHFVTGFAPTYVASRNTSVLTPSIVGAATLGAMLYRESTQGARGAGSNVDMAWVGLGVAAALTSKHLPKPFHVYVNEDTPHFGVQFTW